MNARPYGRPVTRTLIAVACALALPSAAVAATGTGGAAAPTSGGSGLTGLGGSGSGSTTPAPTRPAAAPVSVSSNGITLETRSSALLRHGLSFSGTATGAAGQTIEIEREGRATQDRWQPTVSATVAADGSFHATWNATQVGRFSIRAIKLSGSPTAIAASSDAVPSAVTVSVYRGARATIYGPGFYGRRTACGPRLRPTTLGVANRTLPCGTKVSLVYRGRELTVPVIDRGPYANNASWDVTAAAAAALGMDGTEWIGAIALPGRVRITSGPVLPSLALR